MKLSLTYVVDQVPCTAKYYDFFWITLISDRKAKVHLEDSVKIKMYSFFLFTFLESLNSTHGPNLELLN